MPSPQQDLLHVLAREHRDFSVTFHELMDRVAETPLRHRRRQVASLVLHVAVHVVAERLLVHPLVLPGLARGEQSLRERDREITRLVDGLGGVGGSLHDASPLLGSLQSTSAEFAAHADREELEIFVHARHAATPKRLRRMGRLHVTLQQRLSTRYQREEATGSEPWIDSDLLETLTRWYSEELAAEDEDVTDLTLGSQQDSVP